MRSNIEFKRALRNKLLTLESCREVDNEELNMRCMFCGDSKTNKSKRRLYIKISPNDNLPILYNCFNCNASGILTPSVLRSMSINDLHINSDLIRYNKSSSKKFNQMLGITNNNFKFEIPKPRNTEDNKKKKAYIENRLGIKLSVDELLKLKCVFSLKDFIKHNNIDKYTCKDGFVYYLDKDYVGFLTVNNEFIMFRDVTGTNKLKHNKYSIYANIDNTRKFYVIPTAVNVLSDDPITINIAEGVYDILGVYYHIYNGSSINKIYCAVTGCAYISVIKYFIKLGIVGDNVTINIYSDIDKEPEFYRDILKEIEPWVGEINLYYNKLSKDFGVPKDNIEITRKFIRRN